MRDPKIISKKLINFKPRVQQDPYPTMWPTRKFSEVSSNLLRQQPEASIQQYDYVFKSLLPGFSHGVIFQPNGSVLYQTAKTKGDSERFMKWMNDNYAQLRELTLFGVTGTLVGKMGHRGDKDIFIGYYMIQGELVHYDTPFLVKALHLDEEIFNRVIATSPIGKYATVTIDSNLDKISCQELTNSALADMQWAQGLVGFPYTNKIPRIVKDGTTEAPMPHISGTTIHQRFMGFEYKR